MLRTKLILTFSGLLVLVVGMTALLFWGTNRLQYHYERGLLAHEELEAYVRLSTDAYRHFKQLVDRLVIGAPLNLDDVQPGADRLQASLEHLRRLTRDEVAFVGRSEPEEIEELEQIDRLAELIGRGSELLQEVAQMQGQGRELAARATLIDTLENLIDREFAGVIDSAIVDEQLEVERADRQAAEVARTLWVVAGAAAVGAVVAVVGIGVWLVRAINAPLEQLRRGTQEIARGRLEHRISLQGPEELARLALSFNRMAAELEQKQTQLLLARTGLEHKVKERTEELEGANIALQRLDQVCPPAHVRRHQPRAPDAAHGHPGRGRGDTSQPAGRA